LYTGRLKILIVNDDGIDAPGIAALIRVAAHFGEPVVVAPAHEQSAMSHRLSAGWMPYEQRAENVVAVEAAPVDCVRLGLRVFAPEAEWVFSGINLGSNLGMDVYPSGTVAAAREAAIMGRKSLAISQYKGPGRPVDWSWTEIQARRAIAEALARDLPLRSFWNVNLPHPEDGRADCPIRDCPVDLSPPAISFISENGAFRYCGDYHSRPRQPGADIDLCFSGNITISLLTCHHSVSR